MTSSRVTLGVCALIAGAALLPAAGLVLVIRARSGPESFGREVLGVVSGTAAIVVLLSLAAASLLRRVSGRDDASRSHEERFLAQAAHELRTPISVLRAVAEQALTRERSDAEYRTALEEIADEARRAGEMVANLLDLARIDTGAIILDEAHVSIAALGAEVTHREKSRNPGALLSFRDGGDADIAGNRALLERSLANLVVNAVKHAGRGAHVVVFSGVEGSDALLGVDDDGPGIAAVDVERVLGRFERGASPAGSGTGLGLPLAEGLARAHGGRLEISKSPLGGCRALLRLPVRR